MQIIKNMESEEKQTEVTFKYYLPTHQEEVYVHINASDMASLLWDIDQECRRVEKYEDNASEGRVALAEHIRDMIHSQIDLDKMLR